MSDNNIALLQKYIIRILICTASFFARTEGSWKNTQKLFLSPV